MLLLAGSGLGCGPAMDSGQSGTVSAPQGPCAAVVELPAVDIGYHAPQGTVLTWSTNPPASGTHYPVWAPWAQAFTEIVPRGNWLHNAEHGGVVLLYRCAGDCPDVAAGLASIGTALPQDSTCASPINARWLVTADPLLPDNVQVAAVGWGAIYHASCLDAATLQSFITAHYAHGTEDFCSQGAIAWR